MKTHKRIDINKLREEFDLTGNISVPFLYQIKAYYRNIKYAFSILTHKPVVFFRLLSNTILSRFFKIHMSTFRTMTIAVDYACNFNCPHCNITLMKKPNSEDLSIDDFRKTSASLRKYGVLNYTLTGGEPLLRNDIDEIVRALDPRRNMILIQTNAALLTEKRAIELRKAGVDILCVSLDKMHDIERKGLQEDKLDFAFYDKVIKISRKAGIKVQFLYVVDNKNVNSGEFEEVVNYCFDKDVLVIYNTPIPLGNWADKNNILISKENGEFLRAIEKTTPYARTDKKSNLRGYGCPAFKEKLYMTPYGDIQGCTFLQFSLGNIKRENFDEVFKNSLNLPYFSNYIPLCPPAEDVEFIEYYRQLFKDVEALPVELKEFVEYRKEEN